MVWFAHWGGHNNAALTALSRPSYNGFVSVPYNAHITIYGKSKPELFLQPSTVVAV